MFYSFVASNNLLFSVRLFVIFDNSNNVAQERNTILGKKKISQVDISFDELNDITKLF